MKQIIGQISIFEYIAEKDRSHELEIKGLCDDPYCPECGYEFWTCSNNSEIDCERCPSCGIRVDWTRWHRINDEE